MPPRTVKRVVASDVQVGCVGRQASRIELRYAIEACVGAASRRARVTKTGGLFASFYTPGASFYVASRLCGAAPQ